MPGSRKFCQKGSNFDGFLFGERRKGPNITIYKTGHYQPNNEPPILNGVLLAYRCWPNIEYWFGSFVIFRGVLETLYFCDF